MYSIKKYADNNKTNSMKDQISYGCDSAYI